MKGFLLHNLTLRLVYIMGAFSSSHVVSLISSDRVQDFLSHTGLSITVTDPERLRTYIVGALLVAGEFVFHFVHDKLLASTTKEIKSL